MRVLGVLLLLSSHALADQPRGTYTFDRGSWTQMTDRQGQPLPSCGVEKLFGGQATFVVEYADERILVNRREWRFHSHGVERDTNKPRPDAPVILVDPQSHGAIHLWFGITDTSGSAFGLLTFRGQLDDKQCADAWKLYGNHSR